jgi:DNA processing protein
MNNTPADFAATAAADSSSHSPLHEWLTLVHTPGLGAATFGLLLDRFGSPTAIYNASRSELSSLAIRSDIIDQLRNKQNFSTKEDSRQNISLDEINARVETDILWSRQEDHHIITWSDERYPPQLKQLDDAPPVIYVRGDPDYLSQPQLAIVGTRNPTAAGRNTAREFASHLSSAGITICSGLADGIDGASHTGALEGIAGTVAVVAHGLDIVYPARHQGLAQQISQQGAIISEMPIGTQLQRGLFPRRNRIISALSLGTLVVEAAKRSGSLITARYAIEQNKEVFAIPGSIHNPMARGCHQLIRQGAKLVETADDILEELQISIPKATAYPLKTGADTPEKPKDPHQALDPDHQKLLKCLAYEPASIDELVVRSKFNAAEIASMLLIMELEGIIVCQDGRYTQVK